MKFGVSIHFCIQNTLVFVKNKKNFAIASKSHRKYCYFDAFFCQFFVKNNKRYPPIIISFFKSKIFKDYYYVLEIL